MKRNMLIQKGSSKDMHLSDPNQKFDRDLRFTPVPQLDRYRAEKSSTYLSG